VRIIGGKYKGKRFAPPKNFPSRPTTDFAKEALFNILENRYDFEDLDVLDLFAGTGSIGVEFLSRGAKSVTSVDNHPVSFRFLKSMHTSLSDANWKLVKTDAFKFISHPLVPFDLIFADPPYDSGETTKLPGLIFESGLLRAGGLLIIEHGRETNFENITQFAEIRNYGGVRLSFFEVR
jgi:16S rRNA (guanine966-N2)-methyltransferase